MKFKVTTFPGSYFQQSENKKIYELTYPRNFFVSVNHTNYGNDWSEVKANQMQIAQSTSTSILTLLKTNFDITWIIEGQIKSLNIKINVNMTGYLHTTYEHFNM